MRAPLIFLSLDEAHAVIGASLNIDAAQLKVCRIWPDNRQAGRQGYALRDFGQASTTALRTTN